MARGTLEHLLDELKTLEREELYRLRSALEAQLSTPPSEDAEGKFLQSLLASGLITEIQRPDRIPKRERPLVKIQGKPLSETIIEERR